MEAKDKETSETENVDLRISELKSQLQKSYDIFHKAHNQLGQFSFDSSSFSASSSSNITCGDVPSMNCDDLKEVLNAGSIEDTISVFKSKVEPGSQKYDFPNFSNFMRIMNDLQSNLEVLQKSQDTYSKLADDVNGEMNMLQKRLEESVEEINDLIVEDLDDDDGFSSDGDDEEAEHEQNESLGTDSFSD